MNKEIEIGNILNLKYSCRVINNTEEQYCLYRASDIGKILNIKNIRSVKLININDKKMIMTQTDGGKQKVSYLTYNGLLQIICKCRKKEVIELANYLGIYINSRIYSSIERETIDCILETFSGNIMIEQYRVKNYSIDLYFKDYNLAIECDENQHNSESNILNDNIRENEIKNILGCTFIRYKPYDKNFKIFKLLNEIYIFIK